MEFQDLIFERRSIRGYKPDPVPRELLDEIIEVAAQSPSSMNTQPWNVHVVTGEVLDRIRRGNTEKMLATGKPDREIRGHLRYEGDHRERQKRVAARPRHGARCVGSGRRRSDQRAGHHAVVSGSRRGADPRRSAHRDHGGDGLPR